MKQITTVRDRYVIPTSPTPNTTIFEEITPPPGGAIQFIGIYAIFTQTAGAHANPIIDVFLPPAATPNFLWRQRFYMSAGGAFGTGELAMFASLMPGAGSIQALDLGAVLFHAPQQFGSLITARLTTTVMVQFAPNNANTSVANYALHWREVRGI